MKRGPAVKRGPVKRGPVKRGPVAAPTPPPSPLHAAWPLVANWHVGEDIVRGNQRQSVAISGNQWSSPGTWGGHRRLATLEAATIGYGHHLMRDAISVQAHRLSGNQHALSPAPSPSERQRLHFERMREAISMHSHRLRAHPSQRLHFEHTRQVDWGDTRVGARHQQCLDNVQLAIPNEGGNQRAVRRAAGRT